MNTLQPPLRLSAADKADDTRHADRQCGECQADLGFVADKLERRAGDGLCVLCRDKKHATDAEQRVADLRENCPKCMASILKEVETLLDGWEIEDAVGDQPWFLHYTKNHLRITFDIINHRVLFSDESEEYEITFTETTPPSLVKSALEAAIKASV